MSMQDILSDFVARVNNTKMANKSSTRVIKSKLIVEICKKLTTLGYFKSFEAEQYEVAIEISPKLGKLKRISRPSQRIYGSYTKLPRINDGFGTNIITTSYGVLTSKEAKDKKAGGEFLLQVLQS
jgi:small subunit ribosomal protein S8